MENLKRQVEKLSKSPSGKEPGPGAAESARAISAKDGMAPPASVEPLSLRLNNLIGQSHPGLDSEALALESAVENLKRQVEKLSNPAPAKVQRPGFGLTQTILATELAEAVQADGALVGVEDVKDMKYGPAVTKWVKSVTTELVDRADSIRTATEALADRDARIAELERALKEKTRWIETHLPTSPNMVLLHTIHDHLPKRFQVNFISAGLAALPEKVSELVRALQTAEGQVQEFTDGASEQRIQARMSERSLCAEELRTAGFNSASDHLLRP